MAKKKTQKRKVELVFDNKKREDFLKGFSKRKKQRQRKAQEEIEIKLKEERKRIKLEAKDLKAKFKQSYAPLNEENLKGILDEEEFLDDDDVQVTVTSLDDAAIKSNFIGAKMAQNDGEDEEEEETNQVEASGGIEGMEIGRERKAKKSRDELTEKEIKSERDLKKLIKKQTVAAIKKSKIIQKKNQLNHKRNVKLSNRKKQMKEKFLKKHKKIPKHNR